MPAPSYSLQLGKTALIFFPPFYPDTRTEHPSADAQVVQVIIKPRKSTKRCIELFYKFERDITTAIESLLLGHIVARLPERVTIEGEGYALRGHRRPWKYGQTFVKFSWGEKELRASDDKWIFELDPE
ncbi:hypothetical protein J132_01088 [Termitomyces sp. J132]|nr:hypothetical protein J132_01088 [Termitomyces sp. J132]